MNTLLDIFTVAMVCAGLFFFFAGSIGMLRFPTVPSRLHALTKADNLGLGFIVLGIMPRVAWPFDSLKLIVVWGLILVSAAAVAQIIVISYRKQGRRDP